MGLWDCGTASTMCLRIPQVCFKMFFSNAAVFLAVDAGVAPARSALDTCCTDETPVHAAPLQGAS
jgi:hypothetical protein